MNLFPFSFVVASALVHLLLLWFSWTATTTSSSSSSSSRITAISLGASATADASFASRIDARHTQPLVALAAAARGSRPPRDRAELLTRCLPLLLAPATTDAPPPPPPQKRGDASSSKRSPHPPFFNPATARHDQRCHYVGEPVPPSGPARFAIFTFVQHESQCMEGYGDGAEVLGYGLQKFTPAETSVARFAMLWGGEFSLATLEDSPCVARLVRAGWIPCVAPPIEPPHVMEAGKAEFRQQFIKFALFNMLEFEQVVYMDADVAVFGDISPIFGHVLNATFPLAASLDTNNEINCGLMMLRTGKDIFRDAYDAAMGDTVKFNHRMSEQGFLRAYTRLKGRGWVKLSKGIGANLWRYQHNRKWWNQVEASPEGLRAIHYTTFKPWNCRAAAGCNASRDTKGTGPLIEKWWALRREFETVARAADAARAAAASQSAFASPPPRAPLPLRDGPLVNSPERAFELSTREQRWDVVVERLDALCTVAPPESTCGVAVKAALVAKSQRNDEAYRGLPRHVDAHAMQQYLYELGRACPRPCLGLGEAGNRAAITWAQLKRAEAAGCGELIKTYGLEKAAKTKKKKKKII